MGQAYGSDIRNEIKKYGKEGTGKKFMELQNARREMILKQRVNKIHDFIYTNRAKVLVVWFHH